MTMTLDGDMDTDACDGCALGFSAAEHYADIAEVPVEGVVIAHVRGTDTWRSYALAFRPDLTASA